MASNQDPNPLDPTSVSAISETLETTLEKVVESALQQIVELVCAAMDSCSMAGVTLLDPSGPHTVAATNEATERVDAFQYKAESGPCLDAYRNQVMHRVDATEKDDRWPAFFELARSEGVRSVLSYPLVVHNDGIGALNLYGDREYAFDEEDERIGQAFATHATITLTHARGSWRNGKARQSLERAPRDKRHHRTGQGYFDGADGHRRRSGFRVVAPGITAIQPKGVRFGAGDRRVD